MLNDKLSTQRDGLGANDACLTYSTRVGRERERELETAIAQSPFGYPASVPFVFLFATEDAKPSCW